jgi:nicotinic acid mononucleotide adenylyltransferase
MAESTQLILPEQPAPTPDDIYIWLGGSFSPPTIAHIAIAELVGTKLSEENPDKRINVFFVPVNDYYNKKSVKCVSAADRVQMLYEAATFLNEKHLPNINFYVSRHEILKAETDKDSQWYHKEVKTYDSIKQFVENYGANPENVYLMQGQDNIEGILAGKWVYSHDLIFKSKLICVPRAAANNVVNATRAALRSKLNMEKLNAPESTQTPDSSQPPKSAMDALARVTILDTVPRLVSSTDLRKTIRTWYRKSANNARNLNTWTANTGILNSTKTSTIKPILDYILEKRLYENEEACETQQAKGGRRTRSQSKSKSKRKTQRSLKH